jgi:hypothetical protein
MRFWGFLIAVVGLGLGARPAGAVADLVVTGLTVGGTHTVSESGKAISFTLNLTDAPAQDVSIAAAAVPGAQVEFLPAGPWVITATQPAEIKAVIVRGVENTTTTANADTSVTLTTTSADPNYNGLTKTYTFKNENNDIETGNHSPSEIVISSPKDGATEVTHSWGYQIELPYDSDGDSLTLTLCRDTQADFEAAPLCTEYPESQTAKTESGQSHYASALALFVLGLLFSVRRKYAGAIVVALMFLVGGCGKKNLMDSFDLAPRPRWTIALSGLSPTTTYYWKAYVSDGHGGIVESETRSFTSGASP